MHPYSMASAGMPGYSPWVLPPNMGQPGPPSPYNYFGHQYSQHGVTHTSASQSPGAVPPAGQYGGAPPPPPPSGQVSNSSPLLPAAPPSGMGAWTEHLTPEGLRYYYNTQTGTSSWEMPAELQLKQQRFHNQAVAPLPPLPHQGGAPPQGAHLDKAMEALSMSTNGTGYIPASSSIGGAGAYLAHCANAMSIGSMPGLGFGSMPSGHDGHGGDASGATPASGDQQWWQEHTVNVQ